ncbi:nonsense-mediated mRNA decay factor SMG9 [Hetaerina americana]|uniref:nonsense-mediated mRNA decay factor SMG9 n=1 Tax=Hetaerina americana TaxID=62018 RepID=UPI003A7F273E
MSEYERGKDKRRRKPFPYFKDKDDHGPGTSFRMPIILTKSDRERDWDGYRDRDAKSPAKPITVEKPPQPTIILRNRECDNRALSPNQRHTALRKDSDTPQPIYQLASKSSNAENINPLAPPPEMTSCVKLIDESFQFCTPEALIGSSSTVTLSEFLLDHQTDFLVVGVIGLQGVGKSTILSYLAGNSPDQPNKCLYFKTQTLEQEESSWHCTGGVDAWVSGGGSCGGARIIFLDCQPALSASLMDRMALQEKKLAAADFSSAENAMEAQSLQLASFFLSVCHLVIMVQDWAFDPNILRFLLSAEMLKPSTPTTTPDDEIVEYFPHVLFLQNRCQTSDFTPSRLKMMQDVLSSTFLQSHLQIHSGLGIGTGSILSYLSPSNCGEPINLYLMPDKAEGVEEEYPAFVDLLQHLRNQIYSLPRSPLTTTPLSEKNWFLYASKTWDTVKKSTFFLEYSRLLP